MATFQVQRPGPGAPPTLVGPRPAPKTAAQRAGYYNGPYRPTFAYDHPLLRTETNTRYNYRYSFSARTTDAIPRARLSKFSDLQNLYAQACADEAKEFVRCAFNRPYYGPAPRRIIGMRAVGATFATFPIASSDEEYIPCTSFDDTPGASSNPAGTSHSNGYNTSYKRPRTPYGEAESESKRPRTSGIPAMSPHTASVDGHSAPSNSRPHGPDSDGPSAPPKRRRAPSDDDSAPSKRARTSDGDFNTHDIKFKHLRTASDFANLAADAAFRESILDALSGDPEGAAYWQSVYGTDLREIPLTKIDNNTGTIHRTTDDERVRRAAERIFMTKHRAFLKDQAQRRKDKIAEARRRSIEDRKRREEERRRDREQRRAAEEQRRLDKQIERALRQGRDRAGRAAVKEAFERYAVLWGTWQGAQDAIAWPTLSGARTDMTEKSIRSFFMQGLDLKTVGKVEFLVRLKEQRVRWHPDKMQQKMGGRDHVEKGVMADITMIFQVIDTLYDDTRKST